MKKKLGSFALKKNQRLVPNLKKPWTDNDKKTFMNESNRGREKNPKN